MKLSTKGRYGVRAMADLAIHYSKEPVSIKSISERQNISEYYLEQIFSILRKSNLIKSIRGAQGGYILSKKPEEITIFEILEVLEGPLEISNCMKDEECMNLNNCLTRSLWIKIKKSIDEVVKSTTLKDLICDYENLDNKE
ncbi:HTH-type transcriptional regulator CymR [Clostridium acetireducens DSM 10703]|jgi:Rrf2 family cysteine metabolism transcriptional repressor|uniref:HTH-type transcriptional regulator CymR n=1 Tax=Clostridium acetireducens DSM 10703 TaxID=1121290 RepID=A0A1E8EXL5_9CLOT|nr:Rrf2 family transcriptional regulator [Clostridium acetireducens]OFI05413.1 HTH-type transcriptional regulator CymR [Clostridium acetireducens DSM 10703]